MVANKLEGWGAMGWRVGREGGEGGSMNNWEVIFNISFYFLGWHKTIYGTLSDFKLGFKLIKLIDQTFPVSHTKHVNKVGSQNNVIPYKQINTNGFVFPTKLSNLLEKGMFLPNLKTNFQHLPFKCPADCVYITLSNRLLFKDFIYIFKFCQRSIIFCNG